MRTQSNKEIRAQKQALKRQAKAEGRPFKELWQAHLTAQKEAAAADAAAKAAAERQLHPTTTDLLTEIRNLLVAKQAQPTAPQTPAKTTRKKA